MDPLVTVGWNMRQPEIEELRAENERLMLADRQWADHVKRLAEENERLQRMLASESRGGALLIAEVEQQDKQIERLRAVVDAARKMERWDRDAFGHRLWVEMANALDALDA